MSNQNYAAPEGFTLDAKSGRYYRYDHNDGKTQRITWFDPSTGQYEQTSYPVQQQQSGSTGKMVNKTYAGSKDGFDPQDIEANKAMAAVAYLGPPGWVIARIVAGGGSPYARFHCNQSLVMNIIMFILNVVTGLMIFAVIGLVLFPISALLTLYLVFKGVTNALSGQARKLPFIGGIAR